MSSMKPISIMTRTTRNKTYNKTILMIMITNTKTMTMSK